MDRSNLKVDEEQLIERLRAGERLAYDYFFHKFYPVIYLFSKRIVSDPGIAEEVTLDVFLKIWKKHTDFENIKALTSFLYVAARNACFNAIIQDNRRRKLDAQSAVQLKEAELTVIHEIIRSEVWLELSNAIDTLPKQCAAIIRLIFENDRKPKEIAKELGISVSTVNNQKARGLSLLKSRLSESQFKLLLILIMQF